MPPPRASPPSLPSTPRTDAPSEAVATRSSTSEAALAMPATRTMMRPSASSAELSSRRWTSGPGGREVFDEVNATGRHALYGRDQRVLQLRESAAASRLRRLMQPEHGHRAGRARLDLKRQGAAGRSPLRPSSALAQPRLLVDGTLVGRAAPRAPKPTTWSPPIAGVQARPSSSPAIPPMAPPLAKMLSASPLLGPAAGPEARRRPATAAVGARRVFVRPESAPIKSKGIPGVSVNGRGLMGVLTPSRMALALIERAAAERHETSAKEDHGPSQFAASLPRRPEPLSPAGLLLS